MNKPVYFRRGTSGVGNGEARGQSVDGSGGSRASPYGVSQVNPVSSSPLPKKPIIKYPLSPGGTEIRPPPLPVLSQGNRSTIVESGLAGESQWYSGDFTKFGTCLGTKFGGVGNEGQGNSEFLTLPDPPGRGVTPEEPIKYHPTTPSLAKYDTTTSSIAAGDWLVTLRPIMGGLSPNAHVWWQDVMDVANCLYQTWLRASPVDRLRIRPEQFLNRHSQGQFSRVEQKAIPLLLDAIGTELREDIIANRSLSSVIIIFKTVAKYQPGGMAERQQLLDYIVTPEKVTSAASAVKQLRKWRRWLIRASEVGISLPDVTLQMKGLNMLFYSELPPSSTFRLQEFKTRTLLDQMPTQDAVNQYAELLLGECEAAALIEQAEGGGKSRKLAKANEEGPPSGGSKGDNKGSKGKKGTKGQSGEARKVDGDGLKACYHWMTPKGCPYGKACTFKHNQEELQAAGDSKSRCFICSGKGHMAWQCPTEGHEEKGGKPKGGKGKASEKGRKGESAQAQPKGVEEDKPGSGAASSSQAHLDLLKETQNLIKSIGIKALRVVPVLRKIEDSECQTGLLDSGASACLRSPLPGEDLSNLTPRRVELAEGSTELLINQYGTLISRQRVECIVALKPLIRMGCHWFWTEGRCELVHPSRGTFVMDDSSGCPRMSEGLALELIKEVEEGYHQRLALSVRAIQLEKQFMANDVSGFLEKVVEAIKTDAEVPVWLEAAALKMWGHSEAMSAGFPFAWVPQSGALSSWNRRQRKACRADSSQVLLVYKEGVHWRECRVGHAMGCVPLLLANKEQLLSPANQRLLFELASTGRLSVMVLDCSRKLDFEESVILGVLFGVSWWASQGFARSLFIGGESPAGHNTKQATGLVSALRTPSVMPYLEASSLKDSLGRQADDIAFQCAGWGEDAAEKLKEFLQSRVKAHEAAKREWILTR